MNLDLIEANERAFLDDSYSQHTRDEPRYVWAMQQLRDIGGRRVLEIGSGRGVFLEWMCEEGFEVTATDTSQKYTPPEGMVDHFPYILGDQHAEFLRGYDVVVCLDVLEHLEECDLPTAMRQLASIAPNLVCSVSNHSDVQNGVELHVTQQPASFWAALLQLQYEITRMETAHAGRAYFFTGRRP